MTAYPPPGRKPPDHDERLQVQTRRAFGGGNDGSSRWALPVKNTDPIAQPYQLAAFEEVFHGDDPTVERPDARRVEWIGAATPANATEMDFWYPATI